MCDIAVIFDLVLELILLDEVVELAAKSSRLVDVVDRFFVREDIVNTARLALLLVTTLEAFVLGLRIVSRRAAILDRSTRPQVLSYL